MTEKELLYVEDALGHEKYLISKCRETAECLKDAELKNCASQMEQKHNEVFKSFMGLL
jgi:hypothetical protein